MIARIGPVAAAAVLLGGCGSIGDPLPPLANVPSKVQDLAAVQRGSRIFVQLTIPERTTEGIAMKPPPRLELRIGTASPPFDAAAWAAQAHKHSLTGEPPYAIPAVPWVGKEVSIAVNAIGQNGKESGWSNFANLSVVAEPETPANLKPEATADGVRLTWTGAPGDFRVFRQAAGEPGFTAVGDATELVWLDRATEFGKIHRYLVLRIVKLGDGRMAESEPSPEVAITPADTFPPAAPAGLRAIAGPDSIELSWERNPESDLAGYRVYRAAPGGDFERLPGVSLIPSYSDRAIERGKTYRYAVSAVDHAGNESSRSAVAEAIP